MAVLGASPALSYAPILSQAFSGNASQTIFTLNSSVGATTDLTVVVDNVHQSPYDGSYSVAGTTLTFSEAPATGTNNIYVIYGIVRAGAVTNQVIPDDGSVTTAKLNGNLVTPGNLGVTGTVEVLGGAGGASITLKNGGDLRLQNALNTAAVHMYCDAAGVALVDGKLASTNVSQNFAVSNATSITVSTGTATPIASVSLTTTGKPVLLVATGDANPLQTGGWHFTQFSIDGTLIGKRVLNENGGGASKNCPWSNTHIHQPPAGTWTFAINAWQGVGSMTYGETGDVQAPTIIAVEIL